MCVSNCCITVPGREQALIKSLCVSLRVGQMLRRAPQGAAGPGSHVAAGGLGHWLETVAYWALWTEKSATQREKAGTSGTRQSSPWFLVCAPLPGDSASLHLLPPSMKAAGAGLALTHSPTGVSQESVSGLCLELLGICACINPRNPS